MAMLITPESPLGQELAKWNKPHDVNDPKNRYPKMLYMAQVRPDGRASVSEVDDAVFGGRLDSAAEFTRRCQRIVRSEAEEAEALERGWRVTQKEALERHEAKERALADAAAHRHYEDRNMGELARAEAEAADASTVEHLPEIPEARRARKSRSAA